MKVMKLGILAKMLLVLMITTVLLVRGSQSDGMEFRIPSNGTYSQLIQTSSYVYHMEADEYVKGDILFAVKNAMHRTNGRTTTHYVTGWESSPGYSEATGTNARFREIRGFTQLQPTSVIISDARNNCIRLLNRTNSQTSHLAGQCHQNYGGFRDGTQAWFDAPRQIIKNQMKENTVIIADSGNNALRSLDVITGKTSTLVKLTRLSIPSNILQDISTGNIYVSTAHAISMFHYAEQYISTITGSTEAFADGSFASARFDDPREMLMLSKDKLLLADPDNNRLRVLDLVTRQVSSICSGTNDHTYGPIRACATSGPFSLLVIGDTLYIGSYGAIEMIQGQSAKTPHWIGHVTPEQGGFCIDKTITKVLKPGETKAKVEIVPGIEIRLGLGEHQFNMNKFSFDCTQIINVIEDAGVVRRLSFEANYDVKCSTVAAEGTLKTIMSVAESSFNQLQPICQADCGKLETKKPEIHCTGDVLTITWFTNVTYTADVKKVPRDMQQRLMKRVSSNPILSIFILTKQPPVVFPRKTSDGKYVEITLTNDCRDGKTYSAKDDTCN